MPKQPYVVQEHVRWGDVDLAGIIRYDAYVRFFERGEGEIFRAAGLAVSTLAPLLGIWLPRKLLHLEYQSPAVLDELLSVVTYFTRIGTTSLTINFDVMDAERRVLRCSGHEVLVCVGDAAMVPRPLPDEVRSAFEQWRMTETEARERIPGPYP